MEMKLHTILLVCHLCPYTTKELLDLISYFTLGMSLNDLFVFCLVRSCRKHFAGVW